MKENLRLEKMDVPSMTLSPFIPPERKLTESWKHHNCIVATAWEEHNKARADSRILIPQTLDELKENLAKGNPVVVPLATITTTRSEAMLKCGGNFFQLLISFLFFFLLLYFCIASVSLSLSFIFFLFHLKCVFFLFLFFFFVCKSFITHIQQHRK